MKYLIYTMLFLSLASCSSTRKTVSRFQQEVKKTSLFQKDSTGLLSVDVVSVKRDSASSVLKTDSIYDRITEEIITCFKTDSGEYVETKRTIKEKGQKRTEQTIKVNRSDSLYTAVTNQVQEKDERRVDSSANILAHDKAVKRLSFLPWWIWLIALVLGAIAWWKRNSIIDFFT